MSQALLNGLLIKANLCSVMVHIAVCHSVFITYRVHIELAQSLFHMVTCTYAKVMWCIRARSSVIYQLDMDDFAYLNYFII